MNVKYYYEIQAFWIKGIEHISLTWFYALMTCVLRGSLGSEGETGGGRE